MDLKYENVVIKIGTGVLTGDQGLLDLELMKDLINQISKLKDQGLNVILVSSGAMGAGKALFKPSRKQNTVTNRQILAAVGQVNLMENYQHLFRAKDLMCAQVLTTKEDFRSRKHYLNMKNCFEALLSDNVIPIVNENDVISVQGLMFSDNDELAGLITSMMDMDALVILTDVEGVLDGELNNKNTKIIPEIDPDSDKWEKFVATQKKSKLGRGGMQSKCEIACRLATMGIKVHIAKGRQKNVILDIVNGKKIGTTFTTKKKACPVKRWIATNQGREKGSVVVDEKAKDILQSEKVVSLLPVGISAVKGDFKKGDLIQINDVKGNAIGLGMARYGANRAKQYMGKQGQKPIIHYDQLYLF